jgi:UDP-sulfoquinovose synthase
LRILILGGDGYLGWPTAMHLSAEGHEVTVVDNYLRRRLAQQVDGDPLILAPTLQQRAALWQAKSGKTVKIVIGDLADWTVMTRAFETSEPDAVVHYAEQPSAPFSMLDRDAADLTLVNNLRVTLNLIQAVKALAPDAHIVKLGTMGEYGTPDIDIEEGWIDIDHKGRKGHFLFPRQAGSLYHTTKVMDTDLLWFYVRVWGLRVTDLMQGPVYGLATNEVGLSQGDEVLLPHFAYDEIFGTVLNRFMVQAVAGIPLTVYGMGGQTRGYLDIRDTLQCIRLVCEQPANKGELRILNQFVETFSVNMLAARVQAAAKPLGIDVAIDHRPNPRKELEEHYYNPAHTGLLELGLKPHPLTDEMLSETMRWISSHRDKIVASRIVRNVKWV